MADILQAPVSKDLRDFKFKLFLWCVGISVLVILAGWIAFSYRHEMKQYFVGKDIAKINADADERIKLAKQSIEANNKVQPCNDLTVSSASSVVDTSFKSVAAVSLKPEVVTEEKKSQDAKPSSETKKKKKKLKKHKDHNKTKGTAKPASVKKITDGEILTSYASPLDGCTVRIKTIMNGVAVASIVREFAPRVNATCAGDRAYFEAIFVEKCMSKPNRTFQSDVACGKALDVGF